MSNITDNVFRLLRGRMLDTRQICAGMGVLFSSDTVVADWQPFWCRSISLAEKYRGPVQLKSYILLTRGKEAIDFVDPVTFRGGPLTYDERRDVLREAGIEARRKRKSKKRKQINDGIIDLFVHLF